MKQFYFLSKLAFISFLFLANNTFAQTCLPCNIPSQWLYADAIKIDNSGNPSSLTNFQVLLTINTQTLIGAGKMNANGDDIRFTSNCSDLMHYWIESGINTNTTKIWIKVPSINSNSIDTIIMYYGNLLAPSYANADSTFEFFDDFSQPNLNLAKWQVQGNPTYSINSGILTFSGNSNWEYIRSSTSFNQKVVVEENHANGGVSTGLVLGYTGTHQRYSFRANGANLSTTYDNDVSGGNSFFNMGYPAVPASNNQSLFYTYKAVSSINANTITVDSYCNVSTSNCDNNITSLNTYTGSSFYVGFTSYSPSYIGYLDWIRVRKYTSVEPIITQGSSFLPLPIVNLGNDTTVCGELALDAGPGFVTYTWSPSGNSQVLVVNATGTYAVTVVENTGCKGSDTINVTVNPLPNAGIIAPSSYCTTSPIDTLGFYTPGGTWSGTGIIDNVNGVFDPSTAGVGTHKIYYSVTDGNNCTNTDSVSLEVIICTGIESNLIYNNVLVFPNPSNGIVYIQFKNEIIENSEISIHDVLGKKVYSRSIGLNKSKLVEIDLSNLPKGIYTISIATQAEKQTLKLSLQ
jgi:hypothetical protein